MDGLSKRRAIAHATAAALVAAIIALRLHPQSVLYPACPLYGLFHVRCPGCGATRALAALLRGHWMEAMRWNALFVMALPALMVYAGVVYRRSVSEEEFRWPQVGQTTMFGCAALAVCFAVVRELLRI